MFKTIKVSTAIALLAVAAAPAAAQAAQSEDSAQEVRAYWTPERMETAIPGDALLEGAEAAVPIGDLDLGLGTTQARRAQATKVQNPSRKRYRKHGKVFFSDGGLRYVCSGTSARAKTKSLVLTAGHCTYSQSNGYVNNFMFVPAYKNDNAPFGRWTATDIKATNQWVGSEDIRYDVGMVTVGKLGRDKLAQRVGSRRLAFNKSGNLDYDVIGYPAAEPYDGESMYLCDTKAEGTDNRQKKPEPTRVDCPQTGGSSGGGWVTNSGKLNSVVSYGYECALGGGLPIGLPFPTPPTCNNPEDGKLFGPYFGDVIKQLYRSQKR